MMNEIAASYDDFMAQALNEAKHHKGQQEIAAMMREWVAGSKCVLQRENELYNQVHKEKSSNTKYSPIIPCDVFRKYSVLFTMNWRMRKKY